MKAIVTIKHGRYKESGKFSAWITRIAHNLIIDYFRQEKAENWVSCDEEEHDLLNTVRLAVNPLESEMVNEQVLADVKRLVDSLPDEQREVVQMRFYQDLSFKEIAELTGVSINTSLGRMRYAILNMRRMAEQYNISLALA